MRMICSRTPLRISFAGGGSDIPKFYQKFGGAVLSTTIDKFVYVMVKESFDGKFHLHYKETETCDSVEEIKHPIIRETLKEFNITQGLDISTLSDVPKGTGMGSSSAFAVGLVNCIARLQGSTLSSPQLASKASHIEIVRCFEPIGEQDQTASAFGGFNLIAFSGKTHRVIKLHCPKKHEERLMLFWTGIDRKASSVLGNFTGTNDERIFQMKEMALHASTKLNAPDFDLGQLMFDCWQLKKEAFTASNPQIDQWYDMAMKAGATGGKVLGAGGGGFLLFSADPSNHQAIEKSLGLRRLHFKFWDRGSEIL